MRSLHQFLCLLVCLASFTYSGRVFAQPAQDLTGPPVQELFNQLNNLSVDPTQVYVLHDAKIIRDRVSIYFNRGFIGFLGKAAGEITGAVFTGEGEVLLIPPNPIEKRSMLRFTQSPVLEEKFTFGYLRFTDATARELMAVARPPEPQDLEQPAGYAEQWNPTVHRLNPDFSLRILRDILGGRDRPYFEARLHGGDLGVFSVAVDERLREAVSVGATRVSHANVFGDIWCSFPSRTSQSRSDALEAGPVQAHAYRIDTRIDAGNNLEGHAELELESGSSADRVLIFLLSSRLRVSEVKDEGGQKLEVFQSQSLDGSGVTAGGDDWIAVVLPSAHRIGSRFHLNFTYQGNVIADVGNDVLYVGARGSWYPNCARGARASYDLTFQYPDRLTLVATGKRVEETSSGGRKHSRWISDGTFPVAGFNLGAYDVRLRKVGNTVIEVYATPEAEAALERRHVAAQNSIETKAEPPPGPVILDPLPRIIFPLAPAALLDEVAESASRAVKYFETLFGPFPFPRLAIAQIPGNFGQGWPELVYLPTVSFLPEPARAELGVAGTMQELREHIIVPHEIAHQWWGNELGWKTHHDQWLSEGFASYAAVLYLTQEKDGERQANELLRSYKHDLMARTPEGKTIESGGPIWLGQRLSNSLNPDGYENIVYKKAGWVIHMLHVMMTDPATGSDQRFFKMLRDFVIAYHNANPSTEDFMRHAGKYMTPALDLDHNHSLDWFFTDWVYGTGIPTYKMRATIRRLAPGKYVTQGTIEQSEVAPDFQMLVPVVANYGREKKVTLGLVAVSGSGGHFKFTTSSKPSRVAIDEDNLLAVVH